MPMLIIDTEAILKDKSKISARTAAINGFSIFGKNHTFALDEKMNLQIDNVKSFLEKYKNEKVFVFGFTYIIWAYFYETIRKNNLKINMDNCILVHGGGWKKLNTKMINNEKFKSSLKNNLKLKKIHNYYGMVEQTGSIFVESANCGYLHTSIFSDIFIRDKNFNLLKNKKKGLIQLLSILPTSYPGHNILTEDIGEIIGNDDCKCGLKGKYFLVHGRAKEAEVRGCSDVR